MGGAGGRGDVGVDGRCSGGIGGGGTSMEAAVTVCGEFSTVLIEMVTWALGPNLEGIDAFLTPGPLVCIVGPIGRLPEVVGRRPG